MLLKRGEGFIINKLCKHMKLKKILQNHEERISSNEELLRFFKDEVATRTDLEQLREEMATRTDLEQLRGEMGQMLTKTEFHDTLGELKSDFFTKIDDFVGLYIKVDHEQVAMRSNLARHNQNFEKIEGELNLGLDY